MSKYNQKTETDRLYKHFNSHEHRVERVNDILKELNQVQDVDYFFNTFDMFISNLKKELNAKKYLNSMWYCHD
jgi:DNA-binding response OmpR family regulator|tara:strand:- start:1163 stop:1381 length:219 start_codon:yes stop_codon:yes gene_type:complete